MFNRLIDVNYLLVLKIPVVFSVTEEVDKVLLPVVVVLSRLPVRDVLTARPHRVLAVAGTDNPVLEEGIPEALHLTLFPLPDTRLRPRVVSVLLAIVTGRAGTYGDQHDDDINLPERNPSSIAGLNVMDGL